jgi:H+/gluconate symporter-like permease
VDYPLLLVLSMFANANIYEHSIVLPHPPPLLVIIVIHGWVDK